MLLPIMNWVGPLILVHKYVEIEPSGSLDADPFIVTELAGRVMV